MSRNVMALLALAGAAQAGRVSTELETANGRVPVMIVLKRQFDAGELAARVAGLPKPERRARVARMLHEFSEQEQAGVAAALAAGGVADVRGLWIVNAVYCEADAELARKLAHRPDVAYVSCDRLPLALEPAGAPACPVDEIPWGVQRIRAPEVWHQGWTGQGIVVGVIDTGCDYNHPDFADHLWTDPNYPHHGWDFENNDDDPMDAHGHGTSTAGNIASDGTAGSQCGAAPDAELMILRVRTMADTISENQALQALQFCVAPPLAPENGADVANLALGWMLSWNPQQATWRQAALNAAAAGLCAFATGGSEGSSNPPNNLRCPGHVPPPWWNPENTGVGTLAGVVTSGATDSADFIASMSSQGPVTWQTIAPFNDYAYPPGLTKPDVCAPGIAVKTCQRGGGYTIWSGPAAATGFAAGVTALMLAKDSTLLPAAVDSILEITAVDLGAAGKDNAYGAGRIDALAAVNHIGAGLEQGRASVPPASGPKATVVRGVLRMEDRIPETGYRAELLDAAGRKVRELCPGRNDVTRLPAGVYFVRTESGPAPHRVVVMK